MQYKLSDQFKNKYKTIKTFKTNFRHELGLLEIKDIQVVTGKRSMQKFDLEIEDCHNYFISNVNVHNSPETTPGGRALKFFASVRIDLRRMGHIKKGDELIGSQVKAKVVKNKVAPPFRISTFDIYYDEGLSESSDILNLAIVHGVLKKAGAWISYKDENIAQGNEQGRQLLISNKELREEIKQQVLKLLGKDEKENT